MPGGPGGRVNECMSLGSGGVPARRGVGDTRPSVRAARDQGRQTFLGAERTKEGFLEEVGFDKWVNTGKERGEGWARSTVSEKLRGQGGRRGEGARGTRGKAGRICLQAKVFLLSFFLLFP